MTAQCRETKKCIVFFFSYLQRLVETILLTFIQESPWAKETNITNAVSQQDKQVDKLLGDLTDECVKAYETGI